MNDDPYQPLPPHQRPSFGFRVEGEWYDRYAKSYVSNFTNQYGDMVARPAPQRDEETEDFVTLVDAHLSWAQRPTPFISFFSSYARALQWRYFMVHKKGAKNVSIVCVWLKDNEDLYDAYAIAEALHYRDSAPAGRSDNRRVLKNHEGEYLAFHSVVNEDIFASFDAMKEPEKVSLRPQPGLPSTFPAKVPADAFSGTGESADKTEDLISATRWGELINALDDVKFCVLVLEIVGLYETIEKDGNRVVITTVIPPGHPAHQYTFKWPRLEVEKAWKMDGIKEYPLRLWDEGNDEDGDSEESEDFEESEGAEGSEDSGDDGEPDVEDDIEDDIGDSEESDDSQDVEDSGDDIEARGSEYIEDFEDEEDDYDVT